MRAPLLLAALMVIFLTACVHALHRDEPEDVRANGPGSGRGAIAGSHLLPRRAAWSVLRSSACVALVVESMNARHFARARLRNIVSGLRSGGITVRLNERSSTTFPVNHGHLRSTTSTTRCLSIPRVLRRRCSAMSFSASIAISYCLMKRERRITSSRRGSAGMRTGGLARVTEARGACTGRRIAFASSAEMGRPEPDHRGRSRRHLDHARNGSFSASSGEHLAPPQKPPAPAPSGSRAPSPACCELLSKPLSVTRRGPSVSVRGRAIVERRSHIAIVGGRPVWRASSQRPVLKRRATVGAVR